MRKLSLFIHTNTYRPQTAVIALTVEATNRLNAMAFSSPHAENGAHHLVPKTPLQKKIPANNHLPQHVIKQGHVDFPLKGHLKKQSNQLQTGKGSGICNTNGQGRNCCLLGHVTGLLFCLYLKFLLPSNFNSFDFWINLPLIVLDIELTEKNIIKHLGLFIDGSLQGFPFCPPKIFKPNKQITWNTSHLHGSAWSSGKLEYE